MVGLFFMLAYFMVPASSQFCNGTSFNTSTHICCQSVLSPLPDLTDGTPVALVGCCGSEPFLGTSQLCCQENPPRVLSRDSPRHLCCGLNATYSRTAEVCCEDTVISKPDLYQLYGCCGDKLLKFRDDFCCDRQIQSKPKTLGVFSCCGTELVDNKRTLCCDGVVKHRPMFRPQDWECCGKEVHNVKSHLCCNSQIQVRPGCFSGCCGSTSYDLETQKCCGHVLSRLPTYNSNMYYCCGMESYDVTKQMCCDGNLLEYAPGLDCCGNVTYNATSQICCSGQVHPRNHEIYTTCCDKSPYDVRERRCCWPNLKPRTYGVNTGCCGQKVFNHLTQVCCRGRVKTVEDFNMGLC